MLMTEMTNEGLECEVERLKRMHLQTITEIVSVVTNLNKAFLGKSYQGKESVEDMLSILRDLAEDAMDQYYDVVEALYERNKRRESELPSL